MRWIVIPPVLAAAGALGGVLDAVVTKTLLPTFSNDSDFHGTCAWIGGGVGLGIGASLALARGRWIFVLPAPVVGLVSYVLVGIAVSLAGGEDVDLREHLESPFATRLAAVAVPVLVAAHLAYSRLPRIRSSVARAVAFYSVLGALSGSVFWWRSPLHHGGSGFRPEFWVGLRDGAIYGLAQLGGIALVGCIQPGRRVAEGVSAPR